MPVRLAETVRDALVKQAAVVGMAVRILDDID